MKLSYGWVVVGAGMLMTCMGIGTMTVSPIAGLLLGAVDWRTAMLIIGVLAWVLLIPAALLVRRAPRSVPATDASLASSSAAPEYPLTAAQALCTPQFAAIA